MSCRARVGKLIEKGGGHTWPGAHQGYVVRLILGPVTDSIDANATMWAFFQSQSPKP